MNKSVIGFLAELWIFYGGDSQSFKENWKEIYNKLKEMEFR